MGREGGDEIVIKNTKAEAEAVMSTYQDPSKRYKAQFRCDTVQSDEATARAKAEELYNVEARRVRDNYNIVGYVAFTPKSEDDVNNHSDVLKERDNAASALRALCNESVYAMDGEGRAECSECHSLINVQRSTGAKRGLCDVCYKPNTTKNMVWLPAPEWTRSDDDNTRKRKQHELEMHELKDTFKTVVGAAFTSSPLQAGSVWGCV